MTSQTETPERGTDARPTRLRVRVVDHGKGGEPTVNVSLPIGLVQFGMKMARTFSPELKDVDIDWETVVAAIDAGERGEIVHVEDEAQQTTVDVFVE